MAKKKSTRARKLWGGGYKAATSSIVEKFTESISYDRRLAPFDIRGSIAHATMLGKKRIIPKADAARIVKGLMAIERDIERGKFPWDESLEDVHMNIEAELTRRIGEAGKRLHTGRSRNDQVATAFRLWCEDAGLRLEEAVTGLYSALEALSERFGDAILPGYTHLQQAQPVTVDAWLSAYQAMLLRDLTRFVSTRCRTMQDSPLGAGALAGSTLPLDRAFTAKQLGFAEPNLSTMDAVSDRDFALELLFACSVTQMHLSRLSEDLIIYTSKEFGFVKLDDAVTTGSSLMPQKKNPDVCELTRGRTGRVYGNLVALLTVMKGLPLTYNRDMQEDKEPVFDAVDTVLESLEAMTLVVSTLKFNTERTRAAIDASMLATDLAEHLVEKGVPFREAHEIVARFVHARPSMEGVTAADLAKAHPALRDAAARLAPEEAVCRRGLRGKKR